MIFIFYTYRNSKRYCRVGAGDEKIPGSFETDGFTLQNEDKIDYDPRGFKVLKLKRTNSTRMLQSSMIALKSWRANCDVKILIYETDPKFPDLEEICKVSDYILSYTCKGHLTLSEEKDIISSIVKK